MPVKDLPASIDKFEEVFNVYPLWLCPMRIPRNPKYDQYGGFIHPLEDGVSPKARPALARLHAGCHRVGRSIVHTSTHTSTTPASPRQDEMFVDVGAYGNPAYEGFNAVSACRDAEDFVREKNGYQVRFAALSTHCVG